MSSVCKSCPHLEENLPSDTVQCGTWAEIIAFSCLVINQVLALEDQPASLQPKELNIRTKQPGPARTATRCFSRNYCLPDMRWWRLTSAGFLNKSSSAFKNLNDTQEIRNGLVFGFIRLPLLAGRQSNPLCQSILHHSHRLCRIVVQLCSSLQIQDNN